jgi:hypothetical protein
MLVYMSSFMLSAQGQHEEAIAHAERCVASIGKASRTDPRFRDLIRGTDRTVP